MARPRILIWCRYYGPGRNRAAMSIKRVSIARMVAGPLPPAPLKRAQVIGVRYATGVIPDKINLYFSFKVLVDGLIHCGVLHDDAPEFLCGGEDYLHVRVKTKAEQKCELSVVEVD